MKFIKNFGFTLIIALIISGCATTQNISSGARTKIYKSNYNQTFKAVVQTLSDNGYSINTANSKTGIINTDYSNASTLQAFLTGQRRTKVNAILNKENNGTEIRLNISIQQKGTLTGWESASMTKSQAKKYYDKLFAKIANNLESEN